MRQSRFLIRIPRFVVLSALCLLPIGAPTLAQTVGHGTKPVALAPFNRAAGELGLSAWDPASPAPACRVALDVRRTNAVLRIDVPSGTPSARRDAWLLALAAELGWNTRNLSIHPQPDGWGAVLITSDWPRPAGFNDTRLRLDLSLLKRRLAEVTDRPVLVAVRVRLPSAQDWVLSPAPEIRSLTADGDVAFYRLDAAGAAPLLVRFGVPPRRLEAALLAFLLLTLLPVGAFILFARRLEAEPALTPEERFRIYGRWKRPTQLVTFASAFLLLFLLRSSLVFPLFAGSSTTAASSGLFTLVPIWLMVWTDAVARVAGRRIAAPVPGTSFTWGWKAATVELVGGTVLLGVFVFFRSVGAAAAALSPAARPGWYSLGPSAMMGGTVAILGVGFLGLFLFLAWKADRTWRQAQKKREADPPPAVPLDPEGIRAMMPELIGRADADLEKPLTDLPILDRSKAILERVERGRELMRGLAPEERGALTAASILTYEGKFMHPGAYMWGMPIWSALMTLSGLALWLGTGAVRIAGALVLLFLFVGSRFIVSSMAKLGTRGSRARSDEADLAVARALDDPERYLNVLTRLAALEEELYEKQTAAGLKTVRISVYGERRRRLAARLALAESTAAGPDTLLPGGGR